MTATSKTLPAPDGLEAALVVEEAIWGHRLYDEQTPWLTILEFLMILSAEEREGRGLKEPEGSGGFTYKPTRRLHLRNILFNNPWIDVVRNDFTTSEDRWAAWLEYAKKEAAGLPHGQRDFAYLKERLPSFDDFADIVQLFRSSAIEGESNKRWSSKFVFPFGPDCFYEDLRVKEEKASNDRRFFARTGELLYLMLCRSGKGEELVGKLRPLLLKRDATWNRLARLLQPTEEDPVGQSSMGYLPYLELADFDQLAEDWIRLLDLKMPGYDVLPHLANITGLHLMLYVLRRASEWARSAKRNVVLVLEVIAPTRTLVRQAAVDQYDYNNYLPREAIDGFLDSIWDSDPVKKALRSSAPFENTKSALAGALKIQWKKVDPSATSDPKRLFQEIVKFAQKRHRHHFANIHREYGRQIGLISRRGTRKLRYAPSDGFLKTIVYATVPGRMEFGEFLESLFRDYHFVIGDTQAKEALRTSGADRKAFRLNALRLEERLRALGLIRRLSDDCAYVLNPYFADGDTEA